MGFEPMTLSKSSGNDHCSKKNKIISQYERTPDMGFEPMTLRLKV